MMSVWILVKILILQFPFILTPQLFFVWFGGLFMGGRIRRGWISNWQHYWADKFLTQIENTLGLAVDFNLPVMTLPGPYLVMSNHRSTIDILVIMALMRRLGLTNAKWVLKNALKWVPVVGWSAWLVGSAFIARKKGSRTDVEQLERCAKLAQADRASVVWFPEGTRFTGPSAGFRHVRKPKPGATTIFCRELPDYPILVILIDWQGMAPGENKTMFDAARAMIGQRVRVTASVEANPGAENAPVWQTGVWHRMDDELDRSERSRGLRLTAGA